MSCKEPASGLSRAEEVACVEEENNGVCLLNQASRLLLKHVNCVFVFHFQLSRQKYINMCYIRFATVRSFIHVHLLI